MAKPIITNRALKRLRYHDLSEAQALDAFNSGEQTPAGRGGRWNAVKKYSGYEIGVNYDRAPDGRWVIVSVWKRERK